MASMFEQHSPLAWVAFTLLVLAILAADLGIFHRKSREIPVREALLATAGYITLALCFNVWVYSQFGQAKALEFLTGYFIEYALSMDNILVFVVILAYFQVPAAFQMRVLLWGILGALVLRGLFILAGFALIETFEWTVVVLGAFLIYTGVKTMLSGDEAVDLQDSRAVKISRRLFPITHEYDGDRFFTKLPSGKAVATPLFLVLIVLNVTDIVFALELDPCDLRHHARSLHRVHVERLRNSRSQGALFRLGGHGRQVPLFEIRPVARPDLHRHQDDLQLSELAAGHPDRMGARRDSDPYIRVHIRVSHP